MNSKLHILYAAVFWCVLFVSLQLQPSPFTFVGVLFYVIYFHDVTIEGKY
jgi:hypothetical protein